MYLSIYLSIISIYLSPSLSISLSINLSIYVSIYLSIDRSIYLSIYLSIDRSVYLRCGCVVITCSQCCALTEMPTRPPGRTTRSTSSSASGPTCAMVNVPVLTAPPYLYRACRANNEYEYHALVLMHCCPSALLLSLLRHGCLIPAAHCACRCPSLSFTIGHPSRTHGRETEKERKDARGVCSGEALQEVALEHAAVHRPRVACEQHAGTCMHVRASVPYSTVLACVLACVCACVRMRARPAHSLTARPRLGHLVGRDVEHTTRDVDAIDEHMARRAAVARRPLGGQRRVVRRVAVEQRPEARPAEAGASTDVQNGTVAAFTDEAREELVGHDVGQDVAHLRQLLIVRLRPLVVVAAVVLTRTG